MWKFLHFESNKKNLICHNAYDCLNLTLKGTCVDYYEINAIEHIFLNDYILFYTSNFITRAI